MYVIVVNDDNQLTAPKKARIMQRSKLVDDMWFLVNPMHNGYDMSSCTALLEYMLPVSKQYKSEILTQSEEGYEEYAKYVLPVDTDITSEPGDVELQLSFICTDIDPDGNSIQRVRKTSVYKVTVVPISAWSDIVPDSALSAIDQRIIKVDAQIKELEDMVDTVFDKNTDKENDLHDGPALVK